MKILFLNQFFWPDSSATSQQLTDLATGLAARGHHVSVLCGDAGHIPAPAAEAPKGVHILRASTIPYTRGKFRRMLSYLSFHVTALLRGLFAPRADVVVSFTTPPLIALTGTAIKLVRGSRHFVYEHDLYPDVAVDLNYLKPNGILDRLIGGIADFSRHHADGVIALGECMRDRLIARGIPAERVSLAPDWANASKITPMPRPGDPAETVLLYSGNLGLAHDLDTLTGAMLALKTDTRFRFVFVGSANKREDLTSFVESNDLNSVEFRSFVPRDKLSEGLAIGDIGLVTQHNVCCGSVVPSKVYGILAAGRPVLFIGPRAATPALIVARHKCGWQIDPGDVDGLTQLLLHLAENPAQVQRAGIRARQALVVCYDLPQSVERVEALLEPATAAAEPLHTFAHSQAS